MEEVKVIDNDDFKMSVLQLGSLKKEDIKGNFLFIIKQDKNEVSIEADSERKKIICKVFDPKLKDTAIFEFTLTQFKNAILGNKTKEAIKSEEEKINEKAAEHIAKRTTIDDADSEQSNKQRGRKAKAEKTNKPTKPAKRTRRKRT